MKKIVYTLLNMQTHFFAFLLHFGPFCIHSFEQFFLKKRFPLHVGLFCIFRLFPDRNSCILCLEKKDGNQRRRNFLNHFKRPCFVLDPFSFVSDYVLFRLHFRSFLFAFLAPLVASAQFQCVATTARGIPEKAMVDVRSKKWRLHQQSSKFRHSTSQTLSEKKI